MKSATSRPQNPTQDEIMGDGEEGKEPPRWEDAIDVDDSDLLPLLIPSSSSSPYPQNLSSFPVLRPCSQFPPPPPQTLAPVPSSPPPPSLPRSIQEPPAAAPRSIPGPAGAVQAAMMRRQSAAASARRDSPSTGDRRTDDRGLDLDEEDGDFKLNPWLCALEFLGEDCDLVWPICSIKTRDTKRVPQVVAMVKSCTLNGLGNLFLTLKDPTGSIGASVHHGVLSDCNLSGDISVGCVLILKQVVAFCPARSIRYLNVTSKNVVKLINKDCGSPHKQILPLFAARGKNLQSTFGTMEGEPLRNIAKTFLEESSEKYDHNVMLGNQNIGFGGGLLSDHCATSCTKTFAGRPDSEHMEAGHWSTAGEQAVYLRVNAQEVTRESSNCQRTIGRGGRCHAGSLPFSIIDTAATTVMSSGPNHFLASDMEVGVREAAKSLAVNRAYADNEVRRSLNCGTMIDNSETNSVRSFQCDSVAKTATITMPTKSDLKVNEAKKLISEVSVAQWTDEQLLELFSDYPDEDDLISHGL